jgi:hypothetical protein
MRTPALHVILSIVYKPFAVEAELHLKAFSRVTLCRGIHFAITSQTNYLLMNHLSPPSLL